MKTGDKLICIVDLEVDLPWSYYKYSKGQEYKITQISEDEDGITTYYIGTFKFYIEDIEKHFITLKQLRKQKIEKLTNPQNFL